MMTCKLLHWNSVRSNQLYPVQVDYDVKLRVVPADNACIDAKLHLLELQTPTKFLSLVYKGTFSPIPLPTYHLASNSNKVQWSANAYGPKCS